MKDIDKKILKTIKDILEANPDLRFGQLIGNAVPEAMIYYIEDQMLLDRLCRFYKVDEGEPDKSILEDLKTTEEKRGGVK